LKWTLKEVLFRKKQCAAKYFTQAGICSIGCAPCTRAISEDEDIRAGRWWWESSHKECGLHQNKLLSTKLESSNKLKHKNNPFGFPSFAAGG
jgi:3'-phosphoadenosine 5'-phosphosulfate sulfotransferase (PAPS reductase)/FAD synthetase